MIVVVLLLLVFELLKHRDSKNCRIV